MKNKIFAAAFAVIAALSFTTANAQARGGHVGGFGGGHVYSGGGRVYNGGGARFYNGGGNRYYYNGGRGFGYGLGLGLGLGYGYYGPRYYGPGYYAAPAPQYFVDQYGREYFIDAGGYAHYTGRQF